MHLAGMPPEILCEILAFLDPRMMLQCSTVCRMWHEAISSSPELQYAIELWTDGLTPGHHGSLSATDRLKVLRKRRRAWRNLQWTSQIVVEIAGLQTCKAYELVGGVLAVQEQGPNFCTVHLAELDTDAHAPVTTQVLPMGIDFQNYVDFAMDPTQDFVAILYRPDADHANLSLRTLSGLRPHSMAAHPLIVLAIDDGPLLDLSIHIAHDLIALSFIGLGRLCLWDWKTGRSLADISVLSRTDFRFLSPRAYLLASPADGGRIEIYDISGGGEPSVTNVASLRLPTLASGWSVSSIGVHSGSICAHSMPRYPFSSVDTRQIYLFHVQYVRDTVSFWARLFVHNRTLARYVRQGQTAPIDVAWDDWGPQHTRLLEGDHHRWHRHVHGERAILTSPGFQMHVLDFGITSGRDGEQSALPDWGVGSLVPGPTTIEAEGEDRPFAGDVTTALPFRSSLQMMGRGFDMLLLEQDWIVGTNHQDPGYMTVFTF